MPFWQFYQKLADWLDWPCPVSAALQNGSHDFFFLFYIFIYSFKYETIVRSSAWSFGQLDPGPSSVLYLPPKRESHLRYTAMSLFARNLWVASMASASGLFSSQDFVITSVVNFGKDDIATILATFCFNTKKGKISLILDDKMVRSWKIWHYLKVR